MSVKGEAYHMAQMAAEQTAAGRAARVKEFIADSDPDIIADLFAMIKDAVIDHGSSEALAIANHCHIFAAALRDVEAGLRG